MMTTSGPDVPLSAAHRHWAETSDRHGPRFAPVDGSDAPRLIIFGAVVLAAALCRAARTVGWVPYVVDPRERFAIAERFPDAAQVLVAWPAPAFAQLGGLDADTAVVALTHAPELDDAALVTALSSPAFYVGAMGSRRTQAARRERLVAAGLGKVQIARLAGPAGLDLGGDTAPEAALAILAEAVAARHGRSGGPLIDSGDSIHVGDRP